MGLKEARRQAGLTVLEAARKLEVSSEAVYRWEDGSYFPGSKRLPAIAKLYKCTVDDLLTDTASASNADASKRPAGDNQ